VILLLHRIPQNLIESGQKRLEIDFGEPIRAILA